MNDIRRPGQPKTAPKPLASPPEPAMPIAEQAPPKAPPGAPQEPTRPLSKLKSRPAWLKWGLIGGGLLVLLAIALGVIGYFWYQGALSPRSAEIKNTQFTVDSGATVEGVSGDLESAGLVQSGLAVQLYMRFNGRTDIKAGNYLLSPNQGVAEIVDWLNEGRINTMKVTILPGRTLDELKKDLDKYGFSTEAIDTALQATYDHPLLKDKPAGSSLEGYIFPETFFVGTNTTPVDLFTLSFDEFDKQIEQAGLRDQLAKQNLNMHQGVILASMVSGEVSGLEDRRLVAQVFLKRLSIGMSLGSDVTFVYAAKQLGVEPSSDIDSPYNTRRVVGLPPGPISNFNFEALEAVANPANTTYLYFVSGDDGVNHFSHTLEEQEANIAKYCQRLCN